MALTSVNKENTEIKPTWWQTVRKNENLNKQPKRGDILLAPILSIGDHDIFVELDGKRDGKITKT